MDLRAVALIVLIIASIIQALPHNTINPVKIAEASPDYIPVTIFERSGNDLINYPVRVVLNESNFNGWDKVSSSGSDIYFTDASGRPLYYWVESFDATAKTAVIWVVANVTKHGSTTIRMHYGGLNQYTTYRDPSKVFIFFDDFNTLDTSVWEIVDETSGSVEGSIEATNGYLTFSITTGGAWPCCYGMWIALKNGMDIDGFVVEAKVTEYSGDDFAAFLLSQMPMGDPFDYDPYVVVIYSGYEIDWDIDVETDWWFYGESLREQGEEVLVPAVVGYGMYESLVWIMRTTTWDTNYEAEPTYLNVENVHELFSEKYVVVGIYVYEEDTSVTIDWVRVRKAVFPPPSVSVGTPPSAEYTKLCFKSDFNGGVLTYTLSYSGGTNPFRSFTFEPSGQEMFTPDGRGGLALVAVYDPTGRRYGRLDVELNPIYVGSMKVSFKVKELIGQDYSYNNVHMVRIELVGDGAPEPYYVDISFDGMFMAYGFPDYTFVGHVWLDDNLFELEFAGGYVKFMINKYLIYANYIPYKYNIKKISIIAHEDTSVPWPLPTYGFIAFDDLSISINNNYCWATYEEGSNYYKYEIEVSSYGGRELTNYPVKIVFDATNFNHFRNIAPDGSNIFFVDQSGRPLNYWIEEIDLRDYSTITVGLIPSYTDGDLTDIKLELGTGEVISGSNIRLENGIWKADFSYDLIRGKPITKVMVDTYIESPAVVLWGDGVDIILTTRIDTWYGWEGDLYYIMKFPYIIAWVNVPYIPATGSTKIYMYCGNLRGLNIPRGENNPYKVFPFFEGFDNPLSLNRIYLVTKANIRVEEFGRWDYVDGYVVSANTGAVNGFFMAFPFDRRTESYVAGAKIELGGYYETNNIGFYCDVWIALGLAWLSKGNPNGYIGKYHIPCFDWNSIRSLERLERYPDMEVLAGTVPILLGSWNRIEMVATPTTVATTLNDWFVASAVDTYYMKVYGLMVMLAYTIGRVDYIYLRPYGDPDPTVSVSFLYEETTSEETTTTTATTTAPTDTTTTPASTTTTTTTPTTTRAPATTTTQTGTQTTQTATTTGEGVLGAPAEPTNYWLTTLLSIAIIIATAIAITKKHT